MDAGLWGLGPAAASGWLGRAAVSREQNCWDVGMGSDQKQLGSEVTVVCQPTLHGLPHRRSDVTDGCFSRSGGWSLKPGSPQGRCW